jgi:hypothetical protein
MRWPELRGNGLLPHHGCASRPGENDRRPPRSRGMRGRRQVNIAAIRQPRSGRRRQWSSAARRERRRALRDAAGEVRYARHCRRKMLRSSITGYDPERTSRALDAPVDAALPDVIHFTHNREAARYVTVMPCYSRGRLEGGIVSRGQTACAPYSKKTSTCD